MLYLNRLHLSLIFSIVFSLSACGGGGGDDKNDVDVGDGNVDEAQPPATSASPSLTFAQSKIFRFSWSDVADATFYRLMENPDGASGFTQVSSDIAQGIQTFDHIVPLYARINAQYILQSCNDSGCTDANTVAVNDTLVDAIGYFKASNTGVEDRFGGILSLSADGKTLAVGAITESSNASGIGGNQADNSAELSGAVYIFTRNSNLWTQQAYLKASNTDVDDRFGRTLSLSADANTLAAAAFVEDSNASGVGGNQADNSAIGSGAVYIFIRNGNLWGQQAYLKASNTDAFDNFGSALSLNADGNTLAIGTVSESSNASGVDSNQADNSTESSGAAYVFTRIGGLWTQQAYLKASNTDEFDFFGSALSLSGDGATLAVGAREEDSNATGIGGDLTDNSASNSGAVYLY